MTYRMRILLGLALIGLMAFPAYGEVQNLSSIQITATGAVKATPGVLYSVSGRVTTAASVIYISDGAANDTDTIFWTQGAAADEDRIEWSLPNGVDFPDTGIYVEIDGGANIVVIYK